MTATNTMELYRSTNPKKKYMAVFSSPKKTIHFGTAGMSDFTHHHDEERKRLYLLRHAKREDWTNPRTAGALARYLLWNKKTLQTSLADFKRRFHI